MIRWLYMQRLSGLPLGGAFETVSPARVVVLTQSDRNIFFQPSVSALLLKKIDGPSLDHGSFEEMIGPLGSDHPEYGLINAELREVEAEVIYFAQSQDG